MLMLQIVEFSSSSRNDTGPTLTRRFWQFALVGVVMGGVLVLVLVVVLVVVVVRRVMRLVGVVCGVVVGEAAVVETGDGHLVVVLLQVWVDVLLVF